MWTIDGEPQVWDRCYPGGFDGIVYKWPLRRGEEASFMVVMIGSHAALGFGDITARNLEAVNTRGLSEIGHYLACELPPRVIEIGRFSAPRITLREPEFA